jgi:hypothetical protein
MYTVLTQCYVKLINEVNKSMEKSLSWKINSTKLVKKFHPFIEEAATGAYSESDESS